MFTTLSNLVVITQLIIDEARPGLSTSSIISYVSTLHSAILTLNPLSC